MTNPFDDADDVDAASDAPSERPAGSPRPGPIALSGAQIRRLRALGHHLKPVVMLGKDGLTDAVVDALSLALEAHELVKVKLQSEAPVDRHEVAEALASATRATLVQVLGRTVLLYRRAPKPKIALGREALARGTSAESPRPASKKKRRKKKKASAGPTGRAERAAGPRRSRGRPSR